LEDQDRRVCCAVTQSQSHCIRSLADLRRSFYDRRHRRPHFARTEACLCGITCQAATASGPRCCRKSSAKAAETAAGPVAAAGIDQARACSWYVLHVLQLLNKTFSTKIARKAEHVRSDRAHLPGHVHCGSVLERYNTFNIDQLAAVRPGCIQHAWRAYHTSPARAYRLAAVVRIQAGIRAVATQRHAAYVRCQRSAVAAIDAAMLSGLRSQLQEASAQLVQAGVLSAYIHFIAPSAQHMLFQCTGSIRLFGCLGKLQGFSCS